MEEVYAEHPEYAQYSRYESRQGTGGGGAVRGLVAPGGARRGRTAGPNGMSRGMDGRPAGRPAIPSPATPAFRPLFPAGLSQSQRGPRAACRRPGRRLPPSAETKIGIGNNRAGRQAVFQLGYAVVEFFGHFVADALRNGIERVDMVAAPRPRHPSRDGSHVAFYDRIDVLGYAEVACAVHVLMIHEHGTVLGHRPEHDGRRPAAVRQARVLQQPPQGTRREPSSACRTATSSSSVLRSMIGETLSRPSRSRNMALTAGAASDAHINPRVRPAVLTYSRPICTPQVWLNTGRRLAGA